MTENIVKVVVKVIVVRGGTSLICLDQDVEVIDRYREKESTSLCNSSFIFEEEIHTLAL
jgi:hypothetical protein